MQLVFLLPDALTIFVLPVLGVEWVESLGHRSFYFFRYGHAPDPWFVDARCELGIFHLPNLIAGCLKRSELFFEF